LVIQANPNRKNRRLKRQSKNILSSEQRTIEQQLD